MLSVLHSVSEKEATRTACDMQHGVAVLKQSNLNNTHQTTVCYNKITV